MDMTIENILKDEEVEIKKLFDLLKHSGFYNRLWTLITKDALGIEAK